MHHAILASRPEEVDANRDTRIRLVCNAAGGLLPTLAQELRDVFGGCTVLPSYGMTECMPIASPPPSYRLERPGCSGVACGPYLSIRNPANIDEELPGGNTGAICVRGFPTFQGYEVSPDEPLDTSAISKDGWFDTGDCGWMDADGYLYITGRSKEIINKGGEVISPFEIEEAVMSVAKDRIKATLAFSIDHDVLQEHIGLLVVPANGQPLIGLPELHDRLREQLHPSKWPFVITYMRDLPKNDAGKPLRIGLAPRLKLGTFTDDIPVFRRHFEAQCPAIGTPLTLPIRCTMLVVNEQEVVRSMKTISGIRDVALRVNAKNIEAFTSVFNDTLDSQRISRALINVLPGYAIPAVIHVWNQPILQLPNGEVDFDGMESELHSRQASIMTHEQIVVRDIMARLLFLEPKTITANSDFFLLGGNSMLVGRLAHAIRKETGMDIEISALFTNSTVRAIASTLRGVSLASSRGSLLDRTLAGTATPISASTAHCTTPNWPEPKEPRRGWTHPLSLFVQSIPYFFFYPVKIAWKCMCKPHYISQTGTDEHCRDPHPLHPLLLACLHQFIVLATHWNFTFRRPRRTRYFPYYLTDHGYYLQVDRYWLLQTRRISHVVDISLAMVDCQPGSPHRWTGCVRDAPSLRTNLYAAPWRQSRQERESEQTRQIRRVRPA